EITKNVMRLECFYCGRVGDAPDLQVIESSPSKGWPLHRSLNIPRTTMTAECLTRKDECQALAARRRMEMKLFPPDKEISGRPKEEHLANLTKYRSLFADPAIEIYYQHLEEFNVVYRMYVIKFIERRHEFYRKATTERVEFIKTLQEIK
ncbi:MAG TPA: hypothetical protein VN944_09720, partial [Nitrospiria bacterium]|nr:hypothetical protein [Nitrospiria bacterium]